MSSELDFDSGLASRDGTWRQVMWMLSVGGSVDGDLACGCFSCWILKKSMSRDVDVELFREEINVAVDASVYPQYGVPDVESVSVRTRVEFYRASIFCCITWTWSDAPSRGLACGGPPPVSWDVESISVLCVLLVVVSSWSPWSPFSTASAFVLSSLRGSSFLSALLRELRTTTPVHLFGLLCTMHFGSLWKFRKGVELFVVVSECFGCAGGTVCPWGSDDVFCFSMSGVLSQAVVWVCIVAALRPVHAGCVVMVFGLSVMLPS
ncbi:hypothetical protein Taro_053549 [Colocasia esculenta]|uniref:Uncharacterized protein n=1 Tax=Colocasia esculenta TaxID=4460 RepID=A0A843XLB8_COLES|nr:hypothetical protein [Colocasia esculenta]